MKNNEGKTISFGIMVAMVAFLIIIPVPLVAIEIIGGFFLAVSIISLFLCLYSKKCRFINSMPFVFMITGVYTVLINIQSFRLTMKSFPIETFGFPSDFEAIAFKNLWLEAAFAVCIILNIFLEFYFEKSAKKTADQNLEQKVASKDSDFSSVLNASERFSAGCAKASSFIQILLVACGILSVAFRAGENPVEYAGFYEAVSFALSIFSSLSFSLNFCSIKKLSKF